MGKHRQERFKKKIVSEILEGASVHEITVKYTLPESTVYEWLSLYRAHKNKRGAFTLKQLREAERNYRDAKRKLDILIKSPFIQNVPLVEREKYMELIEKEKDIPSYILCQSFDVDHATYHHFKYDNKRETIWYLVRQKELRRLITKIYLESGAIYGAKKIRFILKRDYHKRASEDFIRKIMREEGFQGARPRKGKRGLNKEYKEAREKKNLLRQNFTAVAPNRKWVSDSKLFFARGRSFCLCVVEDLYSRRIISYRIGQRECGRLVSATLKDAFLSRRPRKGLIIHTDGGAANKSIRINRLIHSIGAIHSYSISSNPYDNSPVESFFSHFTAEFLLDAIKIHPFHSVKEIHDSIEKYIANYNSKRPHSYNNGLTPVEKERAYKLRCTAP